MIIISHCSADGKGESLQSFRGIHYESYASGYIDGSGFGSSQGKGFG
jgi:hypothetical protein